VTVNRFCSSGLQSIAMASDRIRAGGAHILLAGGSESMSMIPFAGNNPAPNPWLTEHHPEVYMNMGLTAEELQRRHASAPEHRSSKSLGANVSPLSSLCCLRLPPKAQSPKPGALFFFAFGG